MKTFDTNVPIPARLSKRPAWNGIVVPFNVFVRPDGTPDFKVTDEPAWIKCVTQHRCGVCGEVIEGDVFFIGGEKSLTNGVFFDPAMHEECARYSFAVCPFLAMKKGYAAKLPDQIEGVTLKVSDAISTERPKRMGILRSTAFQIVRHGDGLLLVAVGERSIEWRDA